MSHQKGMERQMDRNIERIADYFREGEKKRCTALGVEIEHFIIGKDGNSMSYAQVAQILEKLADKSDTLYQEEGHLLGFYNEDYSITLEPASQMEISIAPRERLGEIKNIYESFRKRADKILAKEGYHLVNTGYHPYKRAEELELIPKKRYEYMNRYFEKTGTMGKNMMRATASVQVSVDYENEQDFVEKYRLACMLSPFFYLLTSNSPVFEGKAAETKLVRAYVWMNTDKARCGVFPGTFSENFGYKAYAEYLYKQEPILIKTKDGQTICTGHQKLCEIYGGQEMTRADIEHAVSMFFPDVRLKHYLEIRMADSMEIDKVLEYAALIKTVFYQSKVRRCLTEFLGKVTEEDIEEAKRSLIENGWEGKIYQKEVRKVFEKIMELCRKYGNEEE